MHAGLVLRITEEKLRFVVLLRYGVIRMDGNRPVWLPIRRNSEAQQDIVAHIRDTNDQD